jgi:hypothetical protein
MRFPTLAKFVGPAVLAFAVSGTNAPSAQAANAYCPNASHQRPQKVPADLVGRVAKALQIDAALVRGATFIRCVGPTLMACSIGANLVCGKADTRRTNRGATAWCHDNPGSKVVPLSATGHATIYEWSCADGRAVAGKAMVSVDRQGYIADNWKKAP